MSMTIGFNPQHSTAQKNYGVNNAQKKQVGFGIITPKELENLSRGSVLNLERTSGGINLKLETVILKKLKDGFKLLINPLEVKYYPDVDGSKIVQSNCYTKTISFANLMDEATVSHKKINLD